VGGCHPGELRELLNQITEPAAALRNADSTDKADLYATLGIRLTYQPATRTVQAQASLQPHHMGRRFVSEGRLEPSAHVVVPLGEMSLDVQSLVDDVAPGEWR
jgi:hypothetical protein